MALPPCLADPNPECPGLFDINFNAWDDELGIGHEHEQYAVVKFECDNCDDCVDAVAWRYVHRFRKGKAYVTRSLVLWNCVEPIQDFVDDFNELGFIMGRGIGGGAFIR